MAKRRSGVSALGCVIPSRQARDRDSPGGGLSGRLRSLATLRFTRDDTVYAAPASTGPWHKLLPQRIDFEVRTLQRMRAEDHEIARLREHNKIGCVRSGRMDNGESKRPFERPPVGDDETLRPLGTDSKETRGWCGAPTSTRCPCRRAPCLQCGSHHDVPHSRQQWLYETLPSPP